MKDRSNNMWNSVVRKALYNRLVKEFGPYWTWAKSTLPSNDTVENEKYTRFCLDFSKSIGAKPGGTKSQIAWAITKQRRTTTPNLTVNIFANKTMAYECGFINILYLPSLGKCEYK